MKKTKLFICALFAIVLMPLAYAYGAESGYDEPIVFSYDQALEMAIDNDLTIQDIDTQIRDMHVIIRYTLWDAEMDFFRTRAQIALTDDSIAAYTRRIRNRLQERERSAANGGVAADNQSRRLIRETIHHINNLERQLETLSIYQHQAMLTAGLMLRSAIVAVQEAELGIAVAQEQLALAEHNLRRVTLARELGLASAHDLSNTEHALAQGRTSLEELVRSLYTARKDLNNLLGQPLDQYTVIVFEREVVALDMTQHIAATINQTPEIRLSQLELDAALETRWVYTGHNRYIRITESDRRRARTSTESSPDIARIRNRIALQDAAERAQERHEQTLRTVEAAIRRGFADMEGLLALEATLNAELSQRQAALEIALTSFGLGRATRLEVDAARLAVFEIEQEIEMVRNNMWALSLMLENPGLL
ncbi:MAG: TolC family protein [Defluviitaleaceae bacterium]|nr:TolC family protein [Defluviitaleaceae bacterium]